MHFPVYKYELLYFKSGFTAICSKRFNDEYFNIGSDNGLALNMWHTVIYNNDVKFADTYIHDLT